MIGKKAVVAGATGSVGRLIVKTCLEDPRVDKVTAVVRKTVPNDIATELWGNNNNTSKKLTQLQVDYSTLTVDDEKTKEAFQGTDAFLTALGLYSGGTTEAEMDLVEGSYNRILATIAHDAGGATRGAYLSGQGVKQPSTEGRAFAMFGRAKGRAEEGLAEVFSGDGEAHISARPGGIFDRPGEPVYGFFDNMMTCWPFYKLKDTKFGISAHDIAKGMVQGALFDDDKSHVDGNTIWENEAIKEAARRYEEYFENSN